jgi:methanesulfonate monooxygenase subunit beta
MMDTMETTATKKTGGTPVNPDREIAELVFESCVALDEMNFAGYLALCSPDYRYRIVAYSPEMRKDMVWQDVDKEALQHHLELVPKHVREMVHVSRFPTVCSIKYEEGGKRATVVSGLQVFKTKLDGGETSLYGVCRLHDVVDLANGRPQLLSREVRMHTRQLGTGSQIPF